MAYAETAAAAGSSKLTSPFVWPRSYATTGPPSSPTEPSLPKASGSQNPPSVVPPIRNRKVDLRPAPTKKLGASESSHASPSSPPLSSAPSFPNLTTSSPSPSSSTLSSSTSTAPGAKAERILADARFDIRASETAGILKPPPPDASKIGKLWHQAKQLFKFYYRGIKLQWTHHKIVNDIRARVKAEQAQGIHIGMSRWEAQFVRTHKKDLAKLVPFILILVILEEALPLIVLYAPFMLPSTTILPSQAERIYAKSQEKKAQALGTAKWYAQHEKLDVAAMQTLSVKDLSNDMAWTVSRAFELSDRGPRFLVNRRLATHLAYLAQDDASLRRETGTLLTLNELRNAMGERGQFTKYTSRDELQARLDRWINTVNGESDIIRSFLHYSMTADTSAPPDKKSDQ